MAKSLGSGAEHEDGCCCRRKLCCNERSSDTYESLRRLAAMKGAEIVYRGRTIMVRAPGQPKDRYVQLRCTELALSIVCEASGRIPMRQTLYKTAAGARP